MVDVYTILGFVALLFFVALFIVFRKSIVAIAVDIAWGFAFYLLLLVALGLFAIKIPIDIIFWGFPITVLIVVIIHLMNSSQPYSLPMN